MSEFVEKPIKKMLNKGNPDSRIKKVERLTGPQPSATIRALDELSPDMGDQIAGRFIAPTDESSEPTDSAFSGTYLAAEPQELSDGTQDAWLAKINVGEVEFSVGIEGIYQNRLTNGYKHIADDGTTFRKGELGMTTLEGRTAPSFGLTYQDAEVPIELITNGGFETGDLTGWTTVTGTWSASTSNPYTGNYCALASTDTGDARIRQIIPVSPSFVHVVKVAMYGNSSEFTVTYYSTTDGSGVPISNNLVSHAEGNVWTLHELTLFSPSNAQSAKLQIGTDGSEEGVFDSCSFGEIDIDNYIGFDPVNGKLISKMRDAQNALGQIPVGAMTVPRVDEAKDKLAHTLTTGGAVDVGVHYYITTFVDQYGETNADIAQALSVTVANTTNDRVALTAIPLGKWGTTARKIYRTKVGGAPTNPLDYFLVATIGDNTTTTYNDDATDASLSATTIPTVNTTGSRPAFPKNATLWAKDFISSIGANYVPEAVDNQQLYFTRSQTAAVDSADGDKLTAGVYLEAGTYTIKTLGVTQDNRGIMDYYLDNVLVENGQDWYSGAIVRNVIKTFSVTIPTSGYHILEMVIDGKNASSSDYVFSFTYVMFLPTTY